MTKVGDEEGTLPRREKKKKRKKKMGKHFIVKGASMVLAL